MDPTAVLRVFLSVLLLLAIALNITFMAFGIRHKIGTRLCSYLLRSQTVIDTLQMLVNLINFQYFEFLPQPSQSISDSVWLAYCKLAYSEIFHWCLVCMSVYNLACLAVERCCCISAQGWYRKNQAVLAGCFIAFVLTAPFLSQVPYCLLVTVLVKSPRHLFAAENETSANSSEAVELKRCEFSDKNKQVLMGFGVSYFLLFWILPSVISIVMYLIILRTFRRSKKLHEDARATGKRMTGATKRLTLMTCVTSGAFVLLFAMDSITYLMYCIGVPMEKRGALDSVDSFLLSLNSAVNPVLYLVFMPKFRSFVACAHLRAKRQRRCCDDGQWMGPSAASAPSAESSQNT